MNSGELVVDQQGFQKASRLIVGGGQVISLDIQEVTQ